MTMRLKTAAVFILLAAMPALPVLGQESGGVRINATANDISNTATMGGTAVTRVGASTGGNVRIDAQVDGSVTTQAAFGRTATTEIGTANGNARINVDVGGDVVTSATRRDTGTYIGLTTSDVGHAAGTNVHISGDVINTGGDLAVGGKGICEGYRDNQCCVEFHLKRCVVMKFPKPPKDPCPPGFMYSLGWCRKYADFSHSFSGR